MPITVRRGRAFGTLPLDAAAFLERSSGERAELLSCDDCGERRVRVVASSCQVIVTCVACDSVSVFGTLRDAAEPSRCACGSDEVHVAIASSCDDVLAAARCVRCGALWSLTAGAPRAVRALVGVRA